MCDQAEALRRLVQNAQSHDSLPIWPLIAVAGGQPGVGTTTVSCNLSVALARQGIGVTLIDADLSTPCISERFRLRARHSLPDVASGRRKISEVVERGPCGVAVVPGQAHSHTYSRDETSRLQDQLASLSQQRMIIVDVGGHASPWSRVLGRLNHHMFVVTTLCPVAVMDAYAVIKGLCEQQLRASFATIVNRSTDQQLAGGVHARLAASCDRFLNLDVRSAGIIAEDPVVPQSDQARRPCVLFAPNSPVSVAFQKLAAVAGRDLHASRNVTRQAA